MLIRRPGSWFRLETMFMFCLAKSMKLLAKTTVIQQMLPNATTFTVNTLYNKYYYYYYYYYYCYSSYFSKCINALNMSLFSGSHKVFDVKETMRVCNTKRTLLPCEHRFLSDVAFSVYEVVGVAWQSCSSVFFFSFYATNGPRSGDFA